MVPSQNGVERDAGGAMRSVVLRPALGTIVAVCLLSVHLAAQSGTTKAALTGTVVDTSGGAVPGASVVVKNAGTSVETSTVTNATGVFDVPALDAGRYTV